MYGRLSRVIREAFLHSGQSCSGAARRAKITRPHLSGILGSSRGVSLPVAAAIAEALGYDLDIALVQKGPGVRVSILVSHADADKLHPLVEALKAVMQQPEGEFIEIPAAWITGVRVNESGEWVRV